MVTIKLRAAGKFNFVGLYAPGQNNADKTKLVNLIRGLGFQRDSFKATGRAMLNILLQQLGYTPEQSYQVLTDNVVHIDDLNNDIDYIAETFLVDWGRRLVDPNIWIRTLEQRLKFAKTQNILLDDLSEPNEYHWLKFRGGYTICVLPGREDIGRLNHLRFDAIIDPFVVNKEYQLQCEKAVQQIGQYFST